jgi:hypothetical protein
MPMLKAVLKIVILFMVMMVVDVLHPAAVKLSTARVKLVHFYFETLR